ncbi:MAG: tetratricopeptide repeat protein [candidate division Zixibacteria bacterium]|nr:tetratricopeptide repeat protein [candidate division Zixibacteria bacterium]
MELTPSEMSESLNSPGENEKGASSSNEPDNKRRIFFETKSLAEVYAKQGHISTALEIYRRILKKNPSHLEINQRISELEARRFPKRAGKAKEEE